MTFLFRMMAAAIALLWAGLATAVPITADYTLEIEDCVVFDTGAPFVFADDCTGTLSVTTDTDITFGTPDEGQTGAAVLQITSPTYGTSGAQFFNFLEEVLPGPNGTLVPICLSYCFASDFDADTGLQFNWSAFRGLPFSNGQFEGGQGSFDYEDRFSNTGGPTFGLIANGQIVIAAVPLPPAGAMAVMGLLGLFGWRRWG